MGDIDPRVSARYERQDSCEADRLFAPGFGELTRLRTWELFDRLLPPPPAVVLDVGGGPGIHAEHLALHGYDVRLFDPVLRHVEEAHHRSLHGAAAFEVREAEARQLPVEADVADVVLLMGPLYHLPEPADRLAALAEARRVLRRGGLLIAEVISRFAWLLERAHQDDLHDPDRWRDFDANIAGGMSAPPDLVSPGGFWGYFHRPEEALAEVTASGFASVRGFAVEGFAANLPDLVTRLADESELVLRAVRLVETEPSLLGASPHILITGTKSD